MNPRFLVFTALFAALFAATFAAAPAHAWQLNALGGITNGKPSIDAYSAGTALTYGVTFGFNEGMMLGYETGLLSVGKKFGYPIAGSDFSVLNRAWEIPLLLRFNALPVLSFGIGPYFQSYGGTARLRSEANGAEAEFDYGAAYKKTELGLKLNGRAALFLAPFTRLLFDVSYKRAFTDRFSGASASSKNSEVDVLAGIGFGF